MFGLGQTKKKKETEKKIIANKKAQQHYEGRPDEDVEAMERKAHFTWVDDWARTRVFSFPNLEDEESVIGL